MMLLVYVTAVLCAVAAVAGSPMSTPPLYALGVGQGPASQLVSIDPATGVSSPIGKQLANEISNDFDGNPVITDTDYWAFSFDYVLSEYDHALPTGHPRLWRIPLNGQPSSNYTLSQFNCTWNPNNEGNSATIDYWSSAETLVVSCLTPNMLALQVALFDLTKFQVTWLTTIPLPQKFNYDVLEEKLHIIDLKANVLITGFQITNATQSYGGWLGVSLSRNSNSTLKFIQPNGHYGQPGFYVSMGYSSTVGPFFVDPNSAAIMTVSSSNGDADVLETKIDDCGPCTNVDVTLYCNCNGFWSTISDMRHWKVQELANCRALGGHCQWLGTGFAPSS